MLVFATHRLIAGPDCCADVLVPLAPSRTRKMEQQFGHLEHQFNMGVRVSWNSFSMLEKSQEAQEKFHKTLAPLAPTVP